MGTKGVIIGDDSRAGDDVKSLKGIMCRGQTEAVLSIPTFYCLGGMVDIQKCAWLSSLLSPVYCAKEK